MTISVRRTHPLRRLIAFLFLCLVPLFGQSNRGELRLQVVDPSGLRVKTSVEIVSEANHYHAILATSDQGTLDVQRLPYGIYQLQVSEPGFPTASESVEIHSSINHLVGGARAGDEMLGVEARVLRDDRIEAGRGGEPGSAIPFQRSTGSASSAGFGAASPGAAAASRRCRWSRGARPRAPNKDRRAAARARCAGRARCAAAGK